MNNLSIIIYVFLGGGLGSISRYSISQLSFLQNKFPLGTFTANILACIILGITLFVIRDKVDENLFVKYFIVIGFCGGFSTFSTFSMETVLLFKEGMIAYAIGNILMSILLAVTILWVLSK